MSSILDALKKAEQESARDHSAETPWPAPPSMPSPYREGRRWWVPLGVLVVLCVVGGVFWQVRQPGAPLPADSISRLPAQPLPQSDPGVVPPVAETPTLREPAAKPPQPPPGQTPVEGTRHQATIDASASRDQVSDAMAVATPVRPETPPLPAASPTAASGVQPARSTPAQPVRQTAVPHPVPVAVPTEDTAPRSAETAATNQPAAVQETDKRIRSDPRIELQALVWAPEPTARFVVINSRLVKEGGSVDNIVVVRINPDDVLLAEGSDRWYEVFKIR